MSEVRVTAIVAAYNAAGTIEACLKSITAQTLDAIEIVVADDASTDDTVHIIEAMAAADRRIRLVRCLVNGGPAAARNAVLDRAAGDWIAVVDADVTILPERFAAMVEAGEAANADIVFDDLVYVTDANEAEPGRYLGENFAKAGPVTLESFIVSHRKSCPTPNMGFLKPAIRRSTLGAVRYDTGLKIGEDAMLILQLMARGAKACIVPRALYRYRRHAGSISARQDAASIAAINASYANFLHEHAARLNPEQLRLFNLLIAENERRVAGKAMADDFTHGRLLTLTGILVRQPKLARAFAMEMGSRVKQALRR